MIACPLPILTDDIPVVESSDDAVLPIVHTPKFIAYALLLFVLSQPIQTQRPALHEPRMDSGMTAYCSLGALAHARKLLCHEAPGDVQIAQWCSAANSRRIAAATGCASAGGRYDDAGLLQAREMRCSGNNNRDSTIGRTFAAGRTGPFLHDAWVHGTQYRT